ncbi:MAG: RNA polymerase sigma factor [Microthrixaceae bacterium]
MSDPSPRSSRGGSSRGVSDPDVTLDGAEQSDQGVDDDLAELVDAAREGDAAAFERLVEATYRDTFTLAVRLTGNEEDARDVTQEAYLRAYRGLSNFRGDALFSTWMYRVTANCAATYLGRRNRHRHEQLPEAAELVDLRTDVDPELRADAADTRDRLLVALDSLAPKLRAVIVLRDVYELSHDAIAEELGISTTAAKVRLHRARLKLRSEIHPELDQVASRAV